ncbi:hypothetical protein HRW14_07390 [Streptomyces lunaelactis]|uniref:hypothetical protein n=1 Tax=Streptomyces lunaelactis TaxID=1535768 RepID=UPI001584743E|nr:hypothetical protein [Streptomyces lunaelactis]NUK50123.1 hypothetical protein [Streptomyces lunaelactis]
MSTARHGGHQRAGEAFGDDELTVSSLTKGVPKLHLGRAWQGSTQPLKPLDATSRDILRSHGC